MLHTDFDAATKWYINEINEQAKMHGEPLTGAERELLLTDMFAVVRDSNTAYVAGPLNNRFVRLIRERITHLKAFGAPTPKVRRGLSIPREYHDNFHMFQLFQSEPFIRVVVTNALVRNELGGEKKLWKSK